jgi:dihydrofolate synthase/folylpolyglutamate synthase
MRDKALAEMAQILFPLAERTILTHAETPRAAGTAEIRQMLGEVAAESTGCATVREALQYASANTPKNGLVVVTGSIYIVGEALTALHPGR